MPLLTRPVSYELKKHNLNNTFIVYVQRYISKIDHF